MTLPRPCHQALDWEHSWVGTQKACLEGRTPETLGLTYYHCAWTAGAPAEAVGRPGGPDARTDVAAPSSAVFALRRLRPFSDSVYRDSRKGLTFLGRAAAEG
jgi:hypothetical protein